MAFAGSACGALGQQKAALISPAQNSQTPYIYTGRLTVRHGADAFFGSATSIRRYTGLTCAHLLYDGETGFSTNLYFDPHLYQRANGNGTAIYSFGVLSGYQGAAGADPDSDAAFARDLGYVLFLNPAPNNDWASWQANPDALLTPGPHLILGYAAETLPGTVMASINSSDPYAPLDEGLYESEGYYTQSGMSGGPVYLFSDGMWQIFAETVAGTSPPEIALSDVRAITPDARGLLIDPEYTSGLIKGGTISGPSNVRSGSSAGYKVGVTFIDNKSEFAQLPPRYSELTLVAGGPQKAQVVITKKKKAGKFVVSFGGAPQGSSVELRLVRDTVRAKDQTPLARFTVTVE